MSFVYAVRCNFSRPDLEDGWNAWYSGPKLAEMLTQPFFLSGQRYRAAGLDQTITYLTLWVVETPEAFTTPVYKKNWGFAEWAPHITDWSRNLYRGPDGDVSALLDVPPGGALYFAAFDGVPAPAVESRRRALEATREDIIWMPVVGLDRSVPIIGVRTSAERSQPPPLPRELAAGIRETIYRSITDRARAK
ncbi:MAG: hypothetical protein HY727_10585 [Candidatus Rokubacteria bacterium]|nr:hypothetical protein [Candidatus Rokubacteria bacterium]